MSFFGHIPDELYSTAKKAAQLLNLWGEVNLQMLQELFKKHTQQNHVFYKLSK